MHTIDWIARWTTLILLFAKELAKSVHDVVLNVINPKRVSQSAIVEIPLDVKSDLGIALLANMVTLTPGTTTLHVSKDKTRLYAHVMNYSDSVVTDIKQGFESRILKVLR
ncbi:Na+/H+ antiporter subunit E [Paracandidimonas soli]|uniref:Multicomponent Na+:H+ antiporter subunit E n=1 Tax=Paracandidimonas soli TaxID=1917182 RepID=A0A4R3UZ00_9BURK|nr:Na+/H+ antiporter subunit E [Paracandidimonas soli]TCU96103.1 multicomponent Na+:H+ antiporter subunit E [Paracandidimonas soli]